MTPINRNEDERDDAQRFERLLLDSARADELPGDVSVAWAKFGASVAGVGELATLRVGVEADSRRATSEAGTGGKAIARASRLSAAKWLLFGALAGSALTALGMSQAYHGHSKRAASAPSTGSVARSFAIEGALPPVLAADAGPSRGPREPPARLLEQSKVRRAWSASKTAEAQKNAAEMRQSSTLSAQVALLDAARTAVAAGAFAEALDLTDRFRDEFQGGELAPEADVIAIEALAAQGDREALNERVALFLVRYPGDPHAARVKSLAR